MIGHTIEAKLSFRWSAAVFLILAATLAGFGALARNPHLLIVALLPFLIALALWHSRQRSFTAVFTETTLEIREPALSIPYQALRWVSAENRPRDPAKAQRGRYSVWVVHDDGAVRIPARLNLPSEEVYRFLIDQLPSGGSRAVNPLLTEYVQRNEEAFGAERVFSYRARGGRGMPASRLTARAVTLATLAAGLAWLAIGLAARGDYVGWVAGGAVAAFFGGLLYLAYHFGPVTGPVGLRNWHQASLVISPVGLAMVQGDVQGELRWDEVRGVKLQGVKSFTLSRESYGYAAGIWLTVEGAKVFIADIYDRPLSAILDRIHAYWRRDPGS